MKALKVSVFSLLVAGAALTAITVQQSCGRRTPHVIRMKVGESTILTPQPAMNLTSPQSNQPPKKLLLKFMSGGKEVAANSGATIRFFEDFESTSAFYVLKSEDFPTKHISTQCASSDVTLLDNAIESDVLICDGSLDHSKVHKLELIRSDGSKKSATGKVIESIEGDLLTGSVMFN